MMLKKFVHKQNDVVDFAIGSDGTVVLIDKNNEIRVRNMNIDWW